MNDCKQNNLDVLSSIHEPYWIASTEKTDYPSLKEDINVDVAVIGGGMVGITSAYLLKRKGFKVALLEADKIAHGTSGHTTAKITSQHSLIYYKIKNTYGEEKARQYAEANESSISFIADLVKEKNIDCDFQWRPAYVYTHLDEYVSKIENEAKVASQLGIKACYLDKVPLPFSVKAAVRFDNQAQFHPLKYLLSIAKDIPGDGSNIFENTKVVDIYHDNETCIVITEEGKKIKADKVIVSSHFPCYDGMGMYFARMYQERSYALGVKVQEKFPEGMFITAEDPGRSLRSQRYENSEIIIAGGEHHKTGSHNDTNKHYENISSFMKENYKVESIMYRWSTQDCVTADKIPYVGHLTSRTERIYVATGFRKWGMTNSTAAARILVDLITTGSNPWAPVYDPSRFNVMAAGAKLISQNAEVAVELIKGKLAALPQDVEIRNGEAKKIEVDGEKIGAYRDEQGMLHSVDVTCTHLGCELEWNAAEKTWDCPCHGSRFSYDGDNIDSPAFRPLRHEGEGKNKIDPNII